RRLLALAYRDIGMSHGAVDIGAVASLERRRLVELGVKAQCAGQHVDELLTLVPAETADVLQRGCRDGENARHHALARQFGRQNFERVSLALTAPALILAFDGAPRGPQLAGMVTEKLADIDVEPDRQLDEILV